MLIRSELKKLKEEGYALLDEYVSLDYSHFKKKDKYNKAYTKLRDKLNNQPSHFSEMTTTLQVTKAINCLRRMIKKRKDKNRFRGYDKNIVAPNVRELQKYASELNKNECKCG